MKNSRFIALLLVGILIFSLAGCAGSNEEPAAEEPTEEGTGEEVAEEETGPEPITLSLAYSAAESSPGGMAAAEAKRLIEKKSDGKITVEIYPNAQLGGDRELIEGAQNENIDMISMTTAPLVNFIPELAVFDMPMLFKDIETAKAVMDSEYYDVLAGMYETAGLKLLMAAPDSFRQMSSNVAIKSFEDFEGVKIRTMENKYHMAFWEELGAQPTPLSFGELYISLQQGLVDAQENPYATIVASNLYEQQDYIMDTNHIMFLSTTAINQNIYNNLDPEYQAVIDEAFEEVNEYAYSIGREQSKKALDTITESGTELIKIDSETRTQMQEAAQPVYEMIAEEIGQEPVDKLLDAVDSVQ